MARRAMYLAAAGVLAATAAVANPIPYVSATSRLGGSDTALLVALVLDTPVVLAEAWAYHRELGLRLRTALLSSLGANFLSFTIGMMAGAFTLIMDFARGPHRVVPEYLAMLATTLVLEPWAVWYYNDKYPHPRRLMKVVALVNLVTFTALFWSVELGWHLGFVWR